MLQSIRDRTKGWVAYVIIALIAIPFALFGVYNYFTGGSDPTVAEVGGSQITRTDLDRAVQQSRSRLRRQLGDRYEQFMAATGEQAFRQRQLQQLIDQQVLRQAAVDGGVRVTDAALRAGIQNIGAFQRDGDFSRQAYEQYLQGRGMSAAQFEQRYIQRLEQSRFQQAIRGSALTTKAEVRRAAGLQYQQRDVAWLGIDAGALGKQATLSDDAIEAYYRDHKAEFKRPQQVKIHYLELTQQAVAKRIDISEERLRERYQQVKDTRFGSPASREVRHILLTLPDDASEEKVAKTRQRLLEIRKRIAGGELSFAKAAKQYSEDPGSASQGGDLGQIRRGDMVEPFQKTAFALDKGELSKPVRTEFGWHLLRVDGITRGGSKPFEAVRAELRASMAEEKAHARLIELSKELGNLAFENSESLKPAAQELGLQIQTSDWFSSQQGSGIAAQQAIREAAFNADVLGEGYNSRVLEPSEQRRVVLRVAEQRPQKVLPLAEVRDRVEAPLRRQRGAERASEIAKELRGAVGEGRTPKGLADNRAQVTYTDAGWVTRGSNDVPAPIREALFRLQRPAEGGARTQVVDTDEGTAVVLMRGVRDGELADLDEQQVEQLRQRLSQLDGASAWRDMLAALRQQIEVTINRERL